MVLYVKNKFVSIDGGSFVVDEQGNKLYQIKGKVISPTRKKYIYDINGNLLYIVRNKFWHFFTKKAFIYNADNTKYCKVKERFLGVAPIIANCDDELVCEFAGLGKGVSVYKNGVLIGRWGIGASNLGDVFRDSYRINVEVIEEAPLLVALVIAMDNIHDSRKDND